MVKVVPAGMLAPIRFSRFASLLTLCPESQTKASVPCMNRITAPANYASFVRDAIRHA